MDKTAMAEVDHLSHLIGKIYDTALNTDLWPEALKEATAFVGGSGSSLYKKNPAGNTGSSRYNWGLDPASLQRYYDHYIKIDPVTYSQFVFDVEAVFSVSDC